MFHSIRVRVETITIKKIALKDNIYVTSAIFQTSAPSDILKTLQVHKVNYYLEYQNPVMKEMETPTNFCPSRFLKCVQIYIFCQMIQIANLDVQIFVSVFRFAFLIFCDRKGVQILNFQQQRKSVHT